MASNQLHHDSSSYNTQSHGRTGKGTMCHFSNGLQPYFCTNRCQILSREASRPVHDQLLPKRRRPLHVQVCKGMARVGVGQLCRGTETVGCRHEESEGEGCTRKGQRQKFVQPRTSSNMSLKPSFSRPESSDTTKTIASARFQSDYSTSPSHAFMLLSISTKNPRRAFVLRQLGYFLGRGP